MGYFKFDFIPESELGPKTVLLTPGDATFKIIGIYDKKKDGSQLTTMDGTPKLNVSLSVTDSKGVTSNVYDDLTPKTAWKIKALLDSIGLGALYDKSGTLNPDDLTNGQGKCVVDVKKSEGYEDRNVIKKYIKNPNQANIARHAEVEDLPSDDSIPF